MASTSSPSNDATTIRAGAPLMTLINVFTVEPARQQELVDLLVKATEERMRHLPGFISANIHRGADGTHVVNYAQWRTRADFEAISRDHEAGEHMKKAAAMAQFTPIVCEVASVHHFPDDSRT
ncbi:MAG: antibiotic biosynthesis monooxygenase [Gemmatimonadaceae bacterium]|nr:antibiotic biosynthesis monooxygenase [Gemmatimonadaceae bacterium]